MRTMIITLALFTLILVGCSTSVPTPIMATTATSTAEKAVSSSPSLGGLFAINEVGLEPNGYISLTNFTDQPAELSGLFFCQGEKCSALPNVRVAPEKTVRVAVGNSSGLENVVLTGATIGKLSPSNGEIALDVSKNVNDPKEIRFRQALLSRALY